PRFDLDVDLSDVLSSLRENQAGSSTDIHHQEVAIYQGAQIRKMKDSEQGQIAPLAGGKSLNRCLFEDDFATPYLGGAAGHFFRQCLHELIAGQDRDASTQPVQN